MTEWIITCNINAYNVEGAFDKLDTIDWKQSTYVEKGDIVYIYVGAPMSAIRYKCEAMEVELPEATIDDSEFVLDDSSYENYGRYMRLHLLDKYDNPLMGRSKLIENGLKTVQGPSKVNSQLSAYLFSVIETGGNVFDHFYDKKGIALKTRREAITILQRAYNRPVTARELTDIMYEIGKQQANVHAELTFMEQQGLVIKSGSSVPYGYSVVSNVGTPQYFYVFQNQSFGEESKGEYLQALKQTKDGTENHHWSRLKEVKKGDVIFHGYKQHVVAVSTAKTDAYTIELSDENGAKEGWRVDVNFYALSHSIAPKDYWKDIKLLLPEKYSPFDKNGSGNMGYLFPISQELARYFLDATAGKKVASKKMETESKAMDAEIESLLSGKNCVVIDSLINQFIKKLPEIQPREMELEELRQQFVNDFNMNKLMNMTKEEYVVGMGSKTSFCYRLETELQGLGDIHGSTSAKFGLYFGKSGDDTEEKYRWSKRFGNDPDEVMQELKKQIVYLRMDGEKKDLESIRKCELAPLLRGKILSVFFPEEYLCIFSDEHLDYFIKKLDLQYNPTDDILDKQNKLVEWKKQRPEMKDWNNHLFSSFLYHSFGRPFEEQKLQKDLQKERDNAYPKEYVSKVSITKKQWMGLLQDSEIFKETDIELLKRFYLSDNHAAACYDLSIQDGVSPTSYITPIVALAKRISEKMQLPAIIAHGGSQVWWRVPFWGRIREDGRFEWKVRPELVKAMSALYPELSTSADIEVEEKEDNSLIEELKQANVGSAEGFEYNAEPKEKVAPVYANGHKTYPRDRQTAINALAHANYECEIDATHPSFIRKKSDKKYTEPHHLIPMAFSEEFDVSLDVEENIVSLCSNCHNQIHYGKDADVLLRKLYEERKDALASVGIKITLERLLEMYGYVA